MRALTAISEQELWSRWKERADESAREELIVRHMRIVKFIAGRMAIHVPSNVEMDDLIGWGVLGLLDAIDRFNHKQEIKFTTYASIRVRGAIIDQVRTLDWAPRSLRAMARKLAEARDKLRHELGREPTADALAEALGTTADHVDDTVSQLQTAQVLSLQDYIPAEAGGEPRLLDVVTDPRAQGADAVLSGRERQERIVDAINRLPDQQQKVLHLYYYEELTLKEIGAVLNVSESRICQIHTAALKTLRKAVRGER